MDSASPHFDADTLQRGVGIRFKGRERHDVEEYCVSEGWIRVQAGKTMDRRGRPLLIKLNGEVEPYFANAGGAGDEGEAETDASGEDAAGEEDRASEV
jgi:hypothetical protein